jgi:hypothetical protein
MINAYKFVRGVSVAGKKLRLFLASIFMGKWESRECAQRHEEGDLGNRKRAEMASWVNGREF